MKPMIVLAAACLGLIVAPLPPAQSQSQSLSLSLSTEYERIQIVNQRQPLMFDLQTAYWVLFDVNRGESTDFAAAAQAAGDMGATMQAFVALLPPGTAHGEVPGTRARPTIWSDPEAFDAMVQNFKEAAATMAQVAATGDAAAFRKEFDYFSAACTSCHGLRPSSGGPFRLGVDEL